MLKHYKMTFTEDRETFKTLVIPAESLVDAYIEIQTRFPSAEITEANEGTEMSNGWAQCVAKYMIAHADISEVRTFALFLNDEKREALVNAIWDEWHLASKVV